MSLARYKRLVKIEARGIFHLKYLSVNIIMYTPLSTAMSGSSMFAPGSEFFLSLPAVLLSLRVLWVGSGCRFDLGGRFTHMVSTISHSYLDMIAG